MNELALLNPEHVSPGEEASYPMRKAARAIVVDDQKNIALLHVVNDKYYKLPGGGIEGGEDPIKAVQRECLEEIGCNIEILNELGTIKELRKSFGIVQISYCYVAKIVGEKGIPQLTDEEKDGGFTPVWLPYDTAVEKITHTKSELLEAYMYMVPRDIVFLSSAKEFLNQWK